ncbi:lipocalin-like domain-containing protein [Singulisphaera sp. Ch08]|uniref:Lipocalin-like domain-containing protein n=1 Tax=Singulisphaera sp. Ch08 TaxID=3120278 RepID=A0AAU7CE49_9BACT
MGYHHVTNQHDPRDAGYVYQPTRAVTGDFPAGVDVQTVQRALADAGFGADQVHLFQGEAGAAQLVSYEERPVDGSALFHSLGENPMGIIMYTPDGRMSAPLRVRGLVRRDRRGVPG